MLELHGTLYKTRCTDCGKIEINRKNPITPAMANMFTEDNSFSNEKDNENKITLDQLPHCEGSSGCGSLLRPHIVWFNESLDQEVLRKAEKLMDECDLFLVVR